MSDRLDTDAVRSRWVREGKPRLSADVDALCDEVDRLRAVVDEYARHKDGCARVASYRERAVRLTECDCGFDAALGEQEATPPEPCAKCGYAGGCMEPWAAVSLDDPSDKVLIPCGTCPPCRASTPQGEPEPIEGEGS